MNKKCFKCGEIGGKKGCGFYKDASRKDNYHHYCKFCRKEYERTNVNRIKYRRKYERNRENSEKRRMLCSKSKKKSRKELANWSVRDNIYKKLRRLGLKGVDINITPEMMELQRQLILLGREFENVKNRNQRVKSHA